jgi:hypothetical protein
MTSNVYVVNHLAVGSQQCPAFGGLRVNQIHTGQADMKQSQLVVCYSGPVAANDSAKASTSTGDTTISTSASDVMNAPRLQPAQNSAMAGHPFAGSSYWNRSVDRSVDRSVSGYHGRTYHR